MWQPDLISGQSAIETRFSQSSLSFPCQHNSTTTPQLHSRHLPKMLHNVTQLSLIKQECLTHTLAHALHTKYCMSAITDMTKGGGMKNCKREVYFKLFKAPYLWESIENHKYNTCPF
jgi:hypothetical protein